MTYLMHMYIVAALLQRAKSFRNEAMRVFASLNAGRVRYLYTYEEEDTCVI
jgi:hypothetical protein